MSRAIFTGDCEIPFVILCTGNLFYYNLTTCRGGPDKCVQCLSLHVSTGFQTENHDFVEENIGKKELFTWLLKKKKFYQKIFTGCILEINIPFSID